ncbi:multidrug efflux SMR transporter [Paenibacillus sp. J2TS4]|uniref:DMT family transporter n=1 Tax=Paenibacillus sp. J2TS4 TaxID=2807194 RepID=UPI001B02DADC|nr:multidrug efflux SMR transporter [Paenibacillus sp. J2TS4]GIP34527.1 QacE family quaternary ammonium compound efflux SMR transporter [Paenibacillus sp. J2TS4]
MSWLYLILAGGFEVVGVSGINKVNRERNWQAFLYLLGGFGLSFLFLSLAMNSIPMGTAYAVWTGIGTVGSALVGMLIYGEPRSVLRIVFIAMVLSAAVGLKLIS